MTRLRLAQLYPDQMNIYGDRGNVTALQQRCHWRGIELTVEPIHVGQQVDWLSYDLAFFGGGQDSGQALIAADFLHQQSAGLRAAVEADLVLLAICGGYQLLGHYFLTHTEERLPGVGILDVHTVAGKQRMIGNIVIEAQLSTQPAPVRLVGFENHSGRTYHGSGVQSLGRVLKGYGDNGSDNKGGAVYRNVFGCYLHGSLLPKNPQFADHLLHLALTRRYGAARATELLPPLDDALERNAQQTMVQRLVQ